MSLKEKPSQPPGPMMKNAATAPLICFDNAPFRGSFNGNCEIELTARYLNGHPSGKVMAEMVCVAHLRCTPQSAAVLIDALQNAIRMSQEVPSDMLAN